MAYLAILMILVLMRDHMHNKDPMVTRLPVYSLTHHRIQ